jgi:hypothetical protein
MAARDCRRRRDVVAVAAHVKDKTARRKEIIRKPTLLDASALSGPDVPIHIGSTSPPAGHSWTRGPCW